MADPKVSLVVPIYNNEAGIAVLLRSAQGQGPVPFEVVAVDDGSRDKTANVARSLGARVLVNEHNLGMTPSRNRGIEAAQGEFLWFLDSDMELTPGVVNLAYETCMREGLDGLMIPERSRGTTLWSKSRNLEMITNDADPQRHVMRFVRKSLVKKIGGFDHNLTAGEDYDYQIRMLGAGAKYRLLHEGFIYHHELTTLKKIFRKYYHYGLSMPRYIERHPAKAVGQFSLIRPGYIKRADLFVKHPILTAALFFFKGCQYAAGAAGIMMAKLGWDQDRK